VETWQDRDIFVDPWCMRNHQDVDWEKKSCWNSPFFSSIHDKHSSCSFTKWCTSFSSSGHRKLLGLSCTFSYYPCIYWRPGTKLRGCVGSTSIFSRGSPIMLQMMQNSSGSCIVIGWTLSSTFHIYLYFLLYTTPGFFSPISV
jgi:hypothetical protein